MNKIDQKLVLAEGQLLTTAAITTKVVDLVAEKMDRAGGVNGVLFVNMSTDDGSDDAATVEIKLLTDGNETPVTDGPVLFSGTVGSLKTALSKDGRIRVGLYDSLGKYVTVESTVSAVTPITFMAYLEPTFG